MRMMVNDLLDGNLVLGCIIIYLKFVRFSISDGFQLLNFQLSSMIYMYDESG